MKRDDRLLRAEVLAAMHCPVCTGELRLSSSRYPKLVCQDCGQDYPFVDGIPDMVPPSLGNEPGSYRTETLLNIIAGVYDIFAAPMALAIWRCDPLRYVDCENRALGRANGGLFVRAPVSTGLGLGKLIEPSYHDVHIVGVDRNWQMLKRARANFSTLDYPVQLIRADYRAMPFKTGSVRCLQSFNGLQSFEDRLAVLAEFLRCLEPDGFLSGSALIRGQKDVADVILDRFEAAGIYPLLRTAEFLIREFQDLRETYDFGLQHETHGAVMFYAFDRAEHMMRSA